MVLLKSLKFWTLLIAIGVFVLKTFYPDLPIDEVILLRIVLIVLGFFHIQPEVKALLS